MGKINLQRGKEFTRRGQYFPVQKTHPIREEYHLRTWKSRSVRLYATEIGSRKNKRKSRDTGNPISLLCMPFLSDYLE